MSADKWCARTDLALETQESLKKANTDMRGVNFSEKKLDNGIIVSVVTIDSGLSGCDKGAFKRA